MAGVESLLVDLLEEASLDLIRKLKRPVRIGLSGSQGSGKSSLASAWAKRNPKVAHLSLDDVYLSTAARRALAERVSPLFKTRGAPGSHDLELAKRTLMQLAAAKARDETPLPRFDKLADGPLPAGSWPRYLGTPNVVLVEGWCLGATAQSEAALRHPANALEEKEDKDGRWRAYVNAQLEGPYAEFTRRFDLIVFLKAPSWDIVPTWRLEQEATLRKLAVEALPGEVKDKIARFVLHYERITRHMLEGGLRAEVVVSLDEARAVIGIDGL